MNEDGVFDIFEDDDDDDGYDDHEYHELGNGWYTQFDGKGYQLWNDATPSICVSTLEHAQEYALKQQIHQYIEVHQSRHHYGAW